MKAQSTDSEAARQWAALLENPRHAARWDWHALLRLAQAANPGLPPIGHGVMLEDDPVRLGQVPYMHPPPVEVAELRPPTGAGPSAVASVLSFPFGLFGPMGPLPLFLTEHATRGWKRGGEEGESLGAFANIFHHRFLEYHFRAWADVRKEVDWDLFAGGGGDPKALGWAWLLYVGSLIGIGIDSMRGLDRIPDSAKLFFSGRLLSGSRNAEGLAAILSDYFDVKDVAVIPFVPRRLRIPESSMWRLGGNSSIGRLGQSTLVGEYAEVAQDGFRLRFGPLDWKQFQGFLPGSPGFNELSDWIRFYVGPQSDGNLADGVCPAWDLHLILKADEVPPCRLDQGIQLGWSSWLPGRPVDEDATDLILQPPA